MLSHYEMDAPSLGCPRVSSGGSRSRTGAGCCTGTAARSRIVLGVPDPAGREAHVDGWMTVCVLRTSLLGRRRSSSSSSAFASPARSGRPVGGLRRPNICWLGGPPAPLGRRSPHWTFFYFSENGTRAEKEVRESASRPEEEEEEEVRMVVGPLAGFFGEKELPPRPAPRLPPGTTAEQPRRHYTRTYR